MYHSFVVAAFLQAVLSERGGQFRIEQIARPFDEVEGILVQNLGPSVGIVASTITTVEDVGEVGGAVAGQDLWYQADGIHLLFFESIHIKGFDFVDGGDFVELHVEDGGGDEFGGHEALVEQGTVLNLGDETVGHWLAGFVMLGIHADDLWLGYPVFHDLRRHFHIVVGHIAAGAAVEAIGEEGVQAVAKLVPHGLGFVPSEQGRGVARSRGEVHHERNNGINFLAVDVVATLTETGTPCAAALRFTRIVV